MSDPLEFLGDAYGHLRTIETAAGCVSKFDPDLNLYHSHPRGEVSLCGERDYPPDGYTMTPGAAHCRACLDRLLLRGLAILLSERHQALRNIGYPAERGRVTP